MKLDIRTNRRDELGRGSKIRLRPYDDHDGSGDTYEILSIEGRGASSVCYNAKFHLINGRLKEFNPIIGWENPSGSFYLERDDQTGHLRVMGKNKSELKALEENFSKPYLHLQELRSERDKELAIRVLNNYMPSCQVLCGCDIDGNSLGSTYIWIPGDKEGIEFGKYLQSIKKSFAVHPESNGKVARRILKDFLLTIESITDCLGVLHGAGIVYLDLKPSNFLVSCNSEGNILPEQISIFDLNSVYDIRSKAVPQVIGTDGYMAPELRYGIIDHRADVYSIGAVLYQAIMILDDQFGHYKEDDYRYLARNIRESSLLKMLDFPKKAFLEDALTGILEKTLAYDRSKRYRSCEMVKKDIRRAVSYLDEYTQSVVQTNYADSVIPVQKLLSKYPIYHMTENGKDTIPVVIIGDGTYSRIFLDQILVLGQNLNNPIKISYFAENPETALWRYRSSRPAVQEYVSLNGKCTGTIKEPYATVNFFKISDKTKMMRQIKPSKSCYFFISMETDEQSLKVISNIEALAEKHPAGILACIYLGDGTETEAEFRNYAYIKVGEVVKIPASIERMAFNTFIAWRGSGTLNMREEKRRFRDKYQHRASISSALSVQYKLHMLETEGFIQKGGRKKQAEQLDSLIHNPEFSDMLDYLVMMEHRRWVMDKVTSGWRGFRYLTDEVYYNEFLTNGSVRNEGLKIHPCIAESRTGNVLQTISDKEWDDPDFFPDGIDELDQVSLMIHRTLLKNGMSDADDFESNHGFYCNYKKFDYDLIKAIPDIILHDPSKDTAPVIYEPKPLDTSEVELPLELVLLMEELAENTHDIWAKGRIKEGWTYGKRKSEALKTTPDLVPYVLLPEEEKEYDRNIVAETLKMIIKKGYRIEKPLDL